MYIHCCYIIHLIHTLKRLYTVTLCSYSCGDKEICKLKLFSPDQCHTLGTDKQTLIVFKHTHTHARTHTRTHARTHTWQQKQKQELHVCDLLNICMQHDQNK